MPWQGRVCRSERAKGREQLYVFAWDSSLLHARHWLLLPRTGQRGRSFPEFIAVLTFGKAGPAVCGIPVLCLSFEEGESAAFPAIRHESMPMRPRKPGAGAGGCCPAGNCAIKNLRQSVPPACCFRVSSCLGSVVWPEETASPLQTGTRAGDRDWSLPEVPMHCERHDDTFGIR